MAQRGQKISCTRTETLPNLRLLIRSEEDSSSNKHFSYLQILKNILNTTLIPTMWFLWILSVNLARLQMPRASGAPVLLLARADAPEVPLQAHPQAAPRVDGAGGPGMNCIKIDLPGKLILS